MADNTRIPILDGWRFQLGGRGTCATDAAPCALEFDDTSWRQLDLPHDWQIEQTRDPDDPNGGSQGYFPRDGMGWYRLHFDAPADWAGKAVKVHFDGVQRNSTVWLNGRELGSRPYGYVPFIYDLTDVIIPGAENLLAVRVDNTHGGADRWYSGAGIFRKVWLLVDEPVHIEPWGVCVTTPEVASSRALVKVTVTVANSSASTWGGSLTVRVAPASGSREGQHDSSGDGPPIGSATADIVIPAATEARVGAGSGPGIGASVEAELMVAVDNPRLWDVSDSVNAPALYTATVELRGAAAGEDPSAHVIGTHTVRFGIRTATFDGDTGFHLNGRPLKLKGVNLHHDGGCVGAAVPEKVWRRRFEVLKSMGCNAIRCSHNPQAEEFYDLADELGFIVIDELYDKWVGSGLYFKDLYEEWWERDLEAMVLRDRNHPSVVLWSVGNELEIQYQDQMYELLAAMRDRCRELDPTRPVSLALIPYCIAGFDDRTPLETRIDATLRYADIVDVVMVNYMESFYAALRTAGLTKTLIGSEVFSYYRSAEGQWTQLVPQSPLRDVDCNDWVAGGFIWAGVDYLGEAAQGWPGRGWTGCPVDSAGFRKLRSYHLESQWSDEPVLKLGVFDDDEPWDMAATLWSFPGMRRHWDYEHKRGRILRVAAMTNCDEVRLYLNGEPVRVASPTDSPDRMAHFWLAYAPGALRAEGYRAGLKVAEDVLYTAKRPTRTAMHVTDAYLVADGHDITHVEVDLLDKFDQPYVLANPMVEFSVEGPATLVAVDNGDFSTTQEIYAASRRRIWNGHALAIVRAGREAGAVRITATVEGFAPMTKVIEAR